LRLDFQVTLERKCSWMIKNLCAYGSFSYRSKETSEIKYLSMS
jgi:hypothetical protein